MPNLIEGFPLSPQQKRLWQLQPDNPSYVAQCAVELAGRLDKAALRTALQRICDRHEILRTTFHRQAGKVGLQVVVATGALDWQEFDEAQTPPQLEVVFKRERERPFNLQQGPLLRARLYDLSTDKYLLLLSLPALCADHCTLNNLIRELGRAYETRVDVAEDAVQYSQYAEWQNELVYSADSSVNDKTRDYSDLKPVKLPFERQWSDKQEFNPRAQTITVDAQTLARIETLCRERGAPIASFLLACWHALLRRYLGNAASLVGVACDGRTEEDLELALGLFAKFLPLRCEPAGETPFSNLWQQVTVAMQQGASEQDEFSWDRFLEVHEQLRELSFLPLCFEYSGELPQFSAGEVEFVPVAQYTCSDRFKLKLSVLRRAESLELGFHYDAALFSSEDIDRLVGQFRILLTNTIAQPEKPVGQLEIFSEAELQRVLIEFNRTESNNHASLCIHQLIETQAERVPDLTAVEYEGQRLTYAELNRQANQLAHHLRGLGVGPETRVGFCLERSQQTIVALLGILKAGGAYVPLDPTYPRERLAFILAQAQVSVVVSERSLASRLLPPDLRIVCLDNSLDTLAQERIDNPDSDVASDNLAYILFTSGSTGRPKGVSVEHRQLVNYVQAIVARLNLPPGSSFATVSTFAADLGNTAVFPALCTGGALHVIAQERVSDSNALTEYFSAHPVDCLKIVPSHLWALLSSTKAAQLLPRKRLVLGGEAAGSDLIRKLQEISGETVVVNHYGPTETTVGVLTHQLDPGQNRSSRVPLPLGRPLANTQIYLLDEQLQPVPIWAPGDLYVGGRNLARGYFNRPELTAERFIPNPFSAVGGERLYQTGDVGRYTGEGELEFLGRGDQQVKVRGYRVETGEVEVQLLRHEGVAQAVVMGREQQPGQVGLVGYVVGTGPERLEAAELRRHLAELLPEYMVPGVLVVLEEMPLTANGKVDREALAGMESVGAESGAEYQGPRTVVEELVAGIWAEVLGVARVGMQENFFALGGHSLLATQVMSRVREALQVEMPLRSLFEAPTVAGLARELELARASGPGAVAPAIVPVRRTQALPLSFAQQRLWFLDQLEPGSAFYNVPAAVRMSGPLNVRALEETLTEIVRRHEALRTVFPIKDGQPVQQILAAGPVRLEVTELSALAVEEREREARRLATAEAQRPFNLATGPLLRASLLRLSAEEHVALFTLHHIISDGWSLGVLVREVATLYAAYSAGEVSPLPELTIQYADYAHWQREWLQGEVLAEQLAYWREQLAGAPAVLELPADRPRPAVQSFRGASMAFTLPAELTAALQELSRREGVTLFMTLLAAFQTLLYRYTGQTDICVGTPIAGRNRAETEGLIGFFINTLVLRSRVEGKLTFRELLRQVREVTLGAYAHQDLPFERLVEELQLERDLNYTPLFQVMFSLQNAPREALQLPGLRLDPFGLENDTAKFDLGLSLSNLGDRLSGYLDYKSALFDSDSMAQLLEQWQILLTKIAADPEQSLSDFSLLTAARVNGYSPADFPEAELSQEDFENLIMELSRA